VHDHGSISAKKPIKSRLKLL